MLIASKITSNIMQYLRKYRGPADEARRRKDEETKARLDKETMEKMQNARTSWGDLMAGPMVFPGGQNPLIRNGIPTNLEIPNGTFGYPGYDGGHGREQLDKWMANANPSEGDRQQAKDLISQIQMKQNPMAILSQMFQPEQGEAVGMGKANTAGGNAILEAQGRDAEINAELEDLGVDDPEAYREMLRQQMVQGAMSGGMGPFGLANIGAGIMSVLNHPQAGGGWGWNSTPMPIGQFIRRGGPMLPPGYHGAPLAQGEDEPVPEKKKKKK